MSTSEAAIAAIRSDPHPPVEPGGSLYAPLPRQVRDAGLLERRTGLYLRRIAVTVVLLAAGWTAFAFVGDSWWQLAVAVFLAFVFTQLGFVGHEAGHRQISGSRKVNDVIGLIFGDLAIGLSFGWWVLPPVKALAFIAVQQGLFGLYLGCSFAPNHKGMTILPAEDRSDFLRRQVLTSRNVRGSWLVDYALGGLNYQIENHLFPSMPRPNLRRAQPLVREFCIRHDLPYCETGLITSYAQALRHLHTVGRTLVPTQ